MEPGLKGRSAVITAGSSGIGKQQGKTKAEFSANFCRRFVIDRGMSIKPRLA
jgi:NAD(P)-dependent dehydrogenase (short-subunit alcohol dehydrogenase family)